MTHLVVFKISVRRDPKILTAVATVENSILCSNGRELNCLPPWFNVNLQLSFSKSFGMTRPGIEPGSRGPLVNTLLIRPMARLSYNTYQKTFNNSAVLLRQQTRCLFNLVSA